MDIGSVIIADSHHNMLDGIRGLLSTKFKSVIMVADIDSLLKVFPRLKPDFVVLDLAMPGSGTTKSFEQFLHSFPETKLIVLSTYDDSNVADKVIKSGALGFVLKRKAATDLLDAVDTINNGNIFISTK